MTDGVSIRSLIIAVLAALCVGAVVGYRNGKERADKVSAAASVKAAADNLQRNDEVVNGWAAAVDLLRRRIRNGDAPRIPVSSPAAKAEAAGSADGRSADDVSAAGTLGADLATCQAERARLIDDAALTTIQLRELQAWAK